MLKAFLACCRQLSTKPVGKQVAALCLCMPLVPPDSAGAGKLSAIGAEQPLDTAVAEPVWRRAAEPVLAVDTVDDG